MLCKIYEDVATLIFGKGSFKVGAFKLKLHEKTPDAPLSPIFLNLRTPQNPKQGPLDEGDCEVIALALWDKIISSGLEFDAIAGIPNAADPFIEAMQNLKLIPEDVRVIKLSKEQTEEGRRIVPMPGFDYLPGEKVLLVDDLVTKAGSKIEAINAIEQEDCEVIGLVVLVDREQGGKEELEKSGHRLFSCLGMSDLLDYYVETDRIGSEKRDKILEYLRNN